MLELPFLLNWIGTLTLSLLLKLPPRKLKPWFAPWSFFLLRLLFISINLSYSLVWNLLSCWSISSSCYMDMLDKLQKKLCMTAGPSFIASLETWAHHQNVASASLFYKYYFGGCSFKLAKLVPLPHSHGKSTRYSNSLHNF